MAGFFSGFLEVLKGFITGLADFWTWFTSPLEALSWLGVEIAPIGIFSFTAIMVVFGFVIAHLINPIG